LTFFLIGVLSLIQLETIQFNTLSERPNAMSDAIATPEKITQAFFSLREQNKKVTITTIKDFIGGGSAATIQPILKKLRAEHPIEPPDMSDADKHILAALAESKRQSTENATKVLEEKLEELTNDNDELARRVETLEAGRVTQGNEIAALKDEKTALATKLDILEKALGAAEENISTLQKELESARLDLAKQGIWKEEYEKSREEASALKKDSAQMEVYRVLSEKFQAEAKEALEKASRLEGRLDEIIAHQDGPTAAVKAKPAAAKAKPEPSKES
jgi:chromosome segregation ATPase